MNRRVFVDVDDTLLLYVAAPEDGGANPHGFWKGDACGVNEPLVNALAQACRTHFTLIVWSGGGAKYAKAVADEVFGGGLGSVDAWLDKDRTTFSLVRPEDVVIDDQTLAVPCEQLGPHDIGRLREILHDHGGSAPAA